MHPDDLRSRMEALADAIQRPGTPQTRLSVHAAMIMARAESIGQARTRSTANAMRDRHSVMSPSASGDESCRPEERLRTVVAGRRSFCFRSTKGCLHLAEGRVHSLGVAGHGSASRSRAAGDVPQPSPTCAGARGESVTALVELFGVRIGAQYSPVERTAASRRGGRSDDITGRRRAESAAARRRSSRTRAGAFGSSAHAEARSCP